MASPPDGVVPVRPGMTADLAARLRPEHLREIREIGGLAPVDALALSLAASRVAYAVLGGGGKPMFMMGAEAAGALTGTAEVWMVGTREMDRSGVRVLRAARWGVGEAFAATGAVCLEQYIPEWYETGLRFVRRLGFRVGAFPAKCRDGRALLRATIEKGR